MGWWTGGTFGLDPAGWFFYSDGLMEPPCTEAVAGRAIDAWGKSCGSLIVVWWARIGSRALRWLGKLYPKSVGERVEDRAAWCHSLKKSQSGKWPERRPWEPFPDLSGGLTNTNAHPCSALLHFIPSLNQFHSVLIPPPSFPYSNQPLLSPSSSVIGSVPHCSSNGQRGEFQAENSGQRHIHHRVLCRGHSQGISFLPPSFP